jgi:hypothetical protein
VRSAIVDLQIEQVQAKIAENFERSSEIDSQIAQLEAQLAAWAHCVEDHRDEARGSHFKRRARGSH